MNKISIGAQALVLAFFALTAANNFCAEKKCMEDVLKVFDITDIRNNSANEKIRDLLRDCELNLALKQKEIPRPHPFIYFLAYASPVAHLFGGGLSALAYSSITQPNDSKAITFGVVAAGAAGAYVTGLLWGRTIIRKVNDYEKLINNIGVQRDAIGILQKQVFTPEN